MLTPDDLAVPVNCRSTTVGPRFHVVPTASVWLYTDSSRGGEWWPFTPAGVELYDLRVRHGDRALCLDPARF